MTSIFEKIFESVPIANILSDKNSKIKLVNSYAEKLFGYDRSDLIGMDFKKLISKESQNTFTNELNLEKSIIAQHKDGSVFPIALELIPIETEKESLLMSAIVDVSQQSGAEERFQTAVESAPNGMLMIDAKGIITLVNRQIEILFGYNRNELLGQSIEILVPDEFKAHHPKFVNGYIKSPTPRSMGIGRELYGKKKNGSLFPVEIGLQPLREKAGELQVLASVVDITKRREAEKELEEKSDELQEFAYRTSHDLKSPLTTITSMLQCIQEDIIDNDLDEAITNVKKAESISKNLQSLVQSMLFLTKADMSQEAPSAFDFTKFLEGFELNYKSLIEEHNVIIEHNFIHNKEFMIYPSKLTPILNNLLNNAIKFSHPDRDKKAVRISTYDDMDFLYIQIKDNGLGIPIEKHKDVFTMFKRFHHGIGGHGIGLYMVKKFINKLNGRISFESDKNGTCFYLKFPHS